MVCHPGEQSETDHIHRKELLPEEVRHILLLISDGCFTGCSLYRNTANSIQLVVFQASKTRHKSKFWCLCVTKTNRNFVFYLLPRLLPWLAFHLEMLWALTDWASNYSWSCRHIIKPTHYTTHMLPRGNPWLLGWAWDLKPETHNWSQFDFWLICYYFCLIFHKAIVRFTLLRSVCALKTQSTECQVLLLIQ